MLPKPLKVRLPCGARLHTVYLHSTGRIEIRNHADVAQAEREEEFLALGGRRSLCRQLQHRRYWLDAAIRQSRQWASPRYDGHSIRRVFGMWALLKWLEGNASAREALYTSLDEWMEIAPIIIQQARCSDDVFQTFLELRRLNRVPAISDTT